MMQPLQYLPSELMLSLMKDVLLKQRMALSCELKVPIPHLRRRQGRNRNFQWHGSETLVFHSTSGAWQLMLASSHRLTYKLILMQTSRAAPRAHLQTFKHYHLLQLLPLRPRPHLPLRHPLLRLLRFQLLTLPPPRQGHP